MNAKLIRWIARLLSVGLAALFVALVVGEGAPPLWPLSVYMLLFALLTICHAGLLIAWRWELAGALMALLGMAGFYVVDFANSKFERIPGGWVCPLLFVTTLLYLAAAMSRGTQPVRKIACPSHHS
jgi:hypothetical protein